MSGFGQTDPVRKQANVQNQPGSDFILADCVRFWPNGSGPEASRCARIIRPATGQCFLDDPDIDRMRIGSAMFSGMGNDVSYLKAFLFIVRGTATGQSP